MTNNSGPQLLVPLWLTTESSDPKIGSGNKQVHFIPGIAVYFATGKLAHISDDVIFLFVH